MLIRLAFYESMAPWTWSPTLLLPGESRATYRMNRYSDCLRGAHAPHPPHAEADVAEVERLMLSERDSLRVLDLLENPSAAPDRLVRAAKAGFTLQ